MKELQDRNNHGFLTSKVFALVLIGVASLYVLIMICQALKSNTDKLMARSTEYDSEYQYQTESYDFRPYQSLDTEHGRSEARGFQYN